MDENRRQFIDQMRGMEQFVFDQVCPSLAEKKKDFEKELNDVFKEAIRTAKEEGQFDWENIYKFYKINKGMLIDLYALKIFCTYMFRLFYTFDCSDVRLMVRIIHMYRKVQKEYEDLGICHNCRTLGNPKHFYYEEFVETRSILKAVNKFRPPSYDFYLQELYSQLTNSAIDGDYPFLQFLVKYRLSYLPIDLVEHGKELLTRLANKYHILKHLEKKDEDNQRLAQDILQRYVTSVENPNLLRLILTVRTVNISCRVYMGDTYFPDLVNCLTLFAETLPEAAISLCDVQKFLKFAFPYPDDQAIIIDVCNAFVRGFSESTLHPTPRSLKFLCRCRVREFIQITPTLPMVLSEMHIPDGVSDYISFKSYCI